jgi:DNA-directed RNA polymerase specialized sigma24 family protein
MEETLFLLIKGKNRKAFNYFYNLCGATLYNLIDKHLKDKIQSETVFQNVFVKISQNIDHYDPVKSNLYPWMIDIAQHEIQIVNSGFYLRRDI